MQGVQQPPGGVLGAVMIVPGSLNILVCSQPPQCHSTPITVYTILNERCLAPILAASFSRSDTLLKSCIFYLLVSNLTRK